MYDKQEIERVKLKIAIHKRSYNSFFNQFMLNLIVLFLNVPFVWSHNHGYWWNAVAVGAVVMTLAYIWISMSSEYHDLKFYTEVLNRILMKDENEIDRLNNLLSLKIYDKDLKDGK